MKRYVWLVILCCLQSYGHADVCEHGPGATVDEALQYQLLHDALPPAQQSLVTVKAKAGKRVAPAALVADLKKLRDTFNPTKDPDKEKALADAYLAIDKRITFLKADLSVLEVQVPTPQHTVPISVRVSNPPSTRLRVSLDGLSTGRHVELEWDPAVTTPLVQTVDLATDTWQVSASVEPIFMQQGDGSVVIATDFSTLDGADNVMTMVGAPSALVAGGSVSPGSSRQVPMTGWPSPKISFVCKDNAHLAMDQIEFGGQASTRGGPRSAGVPEIVTQTLSLLAEIAVERAKSGAMAVVKERFVDPLCTDDSKVTLKKLRLGESEELAFPRTCELLESLRLEDILSSGEALLRALRDDGRYTLAPALIAKLTAEQPDLQVLITTVYDVANRVIDRGSFDDLQAQLMVELVGKLDVLLDALPPIKIDVPPELSALIQAEPKIAAIVCPKLDAKKCVDSLFATARTPHEWFRWAKGVAVALTADQVDEVLATFATTLDKYPEVKTALCAATATTDCLKAKGTLIADAIKTGSFTTLVAQLQPVAIAAIHQVDALKKPIGIACQAKLAVAIIKKCSGSSCAATQIEAMLSRPQDSFAKDTAFPASVCWNGDNYLAAPDEVAHFQQIVVDGLALIEPLRTAQTASDRAVAAIDLVLEIVERIHGTRDTRVVIVGEIATAIARGQYDSAFTHLLRLVQQLAKADKVTVPQPLIKLAALSGAVASYASVYKSTKDDDPKAAREARKKSLESLIDAATDRKGRERAWVLSIGSNVGASMSWSNVFDQDDSRLRMAGSPPQDKQLALRVPMGVAYQWLPNKSDSFWKSLFCGKRWGLHFGVNAIDLGQFIHADTSKIQWDSFISPGLEAGFLFGSAEHALSFTVHGSFVPGVSDPAAPTKAQWVYGASIGYYVPFFDLN